MMSISRQKALLGAIGAGARIDEALIGLISEHDKIEIQVCRITNETDALARAGGKKGRADYRKAIADLARVDDLFDEIKAAILLTPARSAAGVAAKLRLALAYTIGFDNNGELESGNSYEERLLAAVLADAEGLAAVSKMEPPAPRDGAAPNPWLEGFVKITDDGGRCIGYYERTFFEGLLERGLAG
jgi:hypothetical protein